MTKSPTFGKVLERIESTFGVRYFENRIDGSDCVVDLDGIPKERLILDLEKFAVACGFTGSRCDYVLFVELRERKVLCVLIELKNGRVGASQVRRQLQGGADLIKRYCQLQMSCCALLIHNSGVSKVDQRKMAKDRIKFEGSVAIIRSLCGTNRNIFRPIKKILEF